MADEGIVDREEELRNAIEGYLANMHSALPVRVLKDSDGKTVSLQPTIKATQTMSDGTTKQIDYPNLDALVHHASGGGTTFTTPVKEGNEGMVIFASRSIHNWREQGGTQQQVDSRRHDLSDAIFIPGIRSKPRDLKDISTDACEMRSDDGKHRSSLHPKDGMKMSVDNGRHVMAWNPDGGISASVEHGKHAFGLNPSSGISMKSAAKVAIDAAGGMNVKGATHFADAVSSGGGFSGPGSSIGGLMGAVIGAVLGTGLTLAVLQGSRPADAIQQARYALMDWRASR